jgi:hypothetical protein
LANAGKEMAKKDEPGFFDAVIVNADLETAYSELKGAASRTIWRGRWADALPASYNRLSCCAAGAEDMSSRFDSALRNVLPQFSFFLLWIRPA